MFVRVSESDGQLPLRQVWLAEPRPDDLVPNLVRGMLSFSSARRTGRCDCSTSRIVPSFSEAEYLIPRLPHPRPCSFDRAVFQREIANHDLHVPYLPVKILHLSDGRRAGRVPCQALLAGLEELLRPVMIQALGKGFPPAELGDAVLATKPLQHHTNLLLGRMVLPGRPADVLYNLLRST